MIYDVEERDCGDKKEIGKEKTNANKVFVNKRDYQFTFTKKLEKVKERADAEENREKEKTEPNTFRVKRTLTERADIIQSYRKPTEKEKEKDVREKDEKIARTIVEKAIREKYREEEKG